MFTMLLARPLFLTGKLCFWAFRRVKNHTSNLIRTIIFTSEKCEKGAF